MFGMIERTILFESLVGEMPCTGKISDSSTSSKKNILKAFFDIMFYSKQDCNLPKDVTITG